MLHNLKTDLNCRTERKYNKVYFRKRIQWLCSFLALAAVARLAKNLIFIRKSFVARDAEEEKLILVMENYETDLNKKEKTFSI